MESLAQQSPERPRHWPTAAVVFGVAAALLWLMAGNLFILGLDEGIYLDGGLRVLHGQAPYRDFFALTGPASYWLEAAAFKLFGVTLASGRVIMVLDVALLAALVYWLAAQLTRRSVALATAFVFFAFETGLSFRLYANHRWDSAALAMLGVAFAFKGAGPSSDGWLAFLASGFFAAAAAWCTPPVILLVVALGLWLLASREGRRFVSAFVLGVLACSLPAIAVLARQHALAPMLSSMAWNAKNYSGPNRVYYGYGAVPGTGGLRAIFAGAHGTALLLRALDFFLTLVPPLVPFAVYVAWLLRTRKSVADMGGEAGRVLLLLAASAAFLLSTYPRWSADELMFVTPIFYVLAAFMLERPATGRWRRGLGAAFAALAGVTLAVSAAGLTREPSLRTRVGVVRAVPQDQELILALDARIPPGSSLFVYPYLPVLYFLTGGVNPTRYDFLQPGMMTARDGATALRELRAHPPKYVVYFQFSPATFYGIWPHANPRRKRLRPIETWLHLHYHLAKVVAHPVAEFAILERNAP
jgi:4-amino-4-deoxy-L-arabinose transferase-like glycosyltransferase